MWVSLTTCALRAQACVRGLLRVRAHRGRQWQILQQLINKGGILPPHLDMCLNASLSTTCADRVLPLGTAQPAGGVRNVTTLAKASQSSLRAGRTRRGGTHILSAVPCLYVCDVHGVRRRVPKPFPAEEKVTFRRYLLP